MPRSRTRTVFIARYRTCKHNPWDRVRPRANPKGEFKTRAEAQDALDRAKKNNKRIAGHVAKIKVKDPIRIDDWVTGDVVPIAKVPAKYRDNYRDTLTKLAEAGEEIGQVIYCSDTFRFRKDQQARYQAYLNGGPIAAKPGTSDHERGLSVDVPNARDNKRLMRALKKRKMIDDVRSEKWHITNIGRKYG